MNTVVLLTVSNIFMTIAWYGHLKYKEAPLMRVVVICWLIAFVEYCFQVPANRIGHETFTAVQLKTIQEIVTLVVFAIFSVTYLGACPSNGSGRAAGSCEPQPRNEEEAGPGGRRVLRLPSVVKPRPDAGLMRRA